MQKRDVKPKNKVAKLTRERLMEIAAEINAHQCHKVENQISDEEFDKISKDTTGQGVIVISRN